MASLSAMMEKAADDIKEFDPPVGTWTAILRRGKFADERTDKNGEEFTKANIAVQLETPGEDVDPIAAAAVADQLERGRLFYSSPLIYSEDQMGKFLKTLRACGAQTTGRTPAQVLATIDGLRVMVDVKREEFKRKDGSSGEETRVVKVYPL
jgi:hypothetical protein